MDPISQFIADWKIPIGAWGKEFFDFLTTNFSWFFDRLSDGLKSLLESLIDLMLWIPPVVLVILIVALAWWLQKSWRLAVAVAVGLLFIINQGLWRETVETLVLVVAATAVSMAIGVPIGIWAAHNPRVTVIFAMPSPIRLTYLGITSVPKPMIEAGQAFGATKRQLLWKVEFPSALPTIMAGLTQCIMLSLSMVVIAALIGANGLGKPVVRALNSVNIPLGVEAGLAIVIVAIILDRICRIGEAK
jgi:glycine betaine/proline transport system permease protein